MSLELMGATILNAVKCPKCGKPIDRTENYKADFIDIPQVSGNPVKVLRGEKVDLVCTNPKCGHRETTNNWRCHIKP